MPVDIKLDIQNYDYMTIAFSECGTQLLTVFLKISIDVSLNFHYFLLDPFTIPVTLYSSLYYSALYQFLPLKLLAKVRNENNSLSQIDKRLKIMTRRYAFIALSNNFQS